MKKLFALLLALAMVFSLAACGGGDDDKTPGNDDKTRSSSGQQTPSSKPDESKPAESQQSTDGQQSGEEKLLAEKADADQQDGEQVDLSGFLGTKTGRFYSQFADGRMYMEYEMEMEGQTMTIISATDGDRTYSETRMGGTSMGVSIMIGEDMYTIDHASKMVIKMSLGTDTQTIAGAVLEESDVDMGDYKTGIREIDGKTYDTEEWIVEGASSIMCFDGHDLAYMIGAFEGEEMIMKIVEVSDDVDDSLFEIPDDYTVMEM